MLDWIINIPLYIFAAMMLGVVLHYGMKENDNDD